jgi:hypothetical protein
VSARENRGAHLVRVMASTVPWRSGARGLVRGRGTWSEQGQASTVTGGQRQWCGDGRHRRSGLQGPRPLVVRRRSSQVSHFFCRLWPIVCRCCISLASDLKKNIRGVDEIAHWYLGLQTTYVLRGGCRGLYGGTLPPHLNNVAQAPSSSPTDELCCVCKTRRPGNEG